jgi:hypothetical protein
VGGRVPARRTHHEALGRLLQDAGALPVHARVGVGPRGSVLTLLQQEGGQSCRGWSHHLRPTPHRWGSDDAVAACSSLRP